MEDNIKTLISKHWNRRAEQYDATSHHDIRNSEQEEIWLQLIRKITANKRLNVLDVGCGTGFLSMLLAKEGHHVTGIDMASDMLKKAEKKAKERGYSIDFQVGDAESLPFHDASFDLVVNRFLVWTLPNPTKAFLEWNRVLKANGRLAIIEGKWDKQTYKSEYRTIGEKIPLYKGSTGENLKTLLEETCFQNVEIIYLDNPLYWDEIPEFERYLLLSN